MSWNPLKSRYFWCVGASFVICFPVGMFATAPYYLTHMNKKFENRTVIITGATGNLGRILSGNLARYKMRVIMACRDMDQCRMLRREMVVRTGNKSIACRHLDLEDVDSINRFADEIIKTEPHVDILINNAAVKDVQTRELTKLLDKLKESAAITLDSRVINIVGSPKKDWKIDLEDINFDKRKYTPTEAYQQSKLALAYFTILLHKSLNESGKRSNIYVFGTNPGWKKICPSMYYPATEWERVKLNFIQLFRQNPSRAIQSTIKCAIDNSILDEDSGKLFSLYNRAWGWGEAAKNEYKGKLTWNMAADMIMKLPDKQVVETSNKDKISAKS